MSWRRHALTACISLGAPAAAAAQGEPIQDNSFLLHEAYNQPAGVVQHVLTAERHANGETLFVFGQEWPLAGVRHQVAFAVPFFCPCGEPGRDLGIGDVELGYRYQVVGVGGGRVHVAPELAFSLPTGSARLERGADALGFGVTLPVSVTLAPTLVGHANAGVSHLAGAGSGEAGRDRRTDWRLGASLVWLTARRLNLLVEGVGDRETFTLSPGVRGAIDLGSVQIVPGVAMPVTFDEGESDTAWLFYLSVEHPYR
jgi:hypothetical protein